MLLHTADAFLAHQININVFELSAKAHGDNMDDMHQCILGDDR